ncbi:MAG TPA: hypothetical protein VNM67_00525 [Thermoanaerobaculia bacterium]|jgi:hypothetical protein|nr:hypothetical protein [Thermoanaerobaculia bacterium]
MRTERDFFSMLGLSDLPWVARVYLVLVVVFAVLLLLSSVPALAVHLVPVASDGLKMVLGALLGALSQAEEVRRAVR